MCEAASTSNTGSNISFSHLFLSSSRGRFKREAASAANRAPALLPHTSSLQTKSPYSLFSATPLPAPSKAAALEPPPVAQNIRAQILAGMDIDLASLLSLIPVSDSNRQIDCGEFSVTLKNQSSNNSRILSFAEFVIAFSRYTEVICSPTDDVN